ncbi:MAG TPA: electron transport complex subunit RsxC [Chitinivibrionales bacterium]|nr:electron transport complex subunit RsxC [Chitinivibrionales bacterium]
MFRSLGFRGGIHPPRDKNSTAESPIEVMPSPERAIVPVLQHAGPAARILVRRGDKVRVGQSIAEPSGPDSAAVHSPVSGTVISVGDFPHPRGGRGLAAEIENDGADTAVEMSGMDKPWNDADPMEIVERIRACGVVGMGGAGVPVQAKILPGAVKPAETLIVNCTECEPLATADLRLVKEHAVEILTGALIIRKVLGAKRALVAVDSGPGGVMPCLATACKKPEFGDLTLAPVAPKYPQSEEKILVRTLTRREVPPGGTCADAGCVVLNAATVFAVARAVLSGIPLYERVLTAGGPCAAAPKNLLVRVGTPVSAVLEHCKTDMKRARKVVMGGPMRGVALAELDTPVIKTTYGVFAFESLAPAVQQYNCIGCGRCMRACPMRLVPAYLRRFVDKNMIDEAAQWGIADCIECGSCAYVCPSKINLVHYMMLGKHRLAALAKGEAA